MVFDASDEDRVRSLCREIYGTAAVEEGKISPKDLELISVTDDVDEVVEKMNAAAGLASDPAGSGGGGYF